jgi:hypothetical protein
VYPNGKNETLTARTKVQELSNGYMFFFKKKKSRKLDLHWARGQKKNQGSATRMGFVYADFETETFSRS